MNRGEDANNLLARDQDSTAMGNGTPRTSNGSVATSHSQVSKPPEISNSSYSSASSADQQHPPGPAFPAYGNYGSSLQQPGVVSFPYTGNTTSNQSTDPRVDSTTQQLQQTGLCDDNSSPLPEAAPVPKTDPVELSLLASYLEIVRKTQGEAAAAEAMAASGLPQGPTAAAIPIPASTGAFEAQRRQQQLHSAASSAAGGAEEQIAVSNLLGFIKQRKLTGVGQLPPPSHGTGRRSSSGSVGSVASVTGSTTGTVGRAASTADARKVWIQPSGPRRPGEGVENEEQGILSAEEVPSTGEVMMRITLLAAGFVIGPSGASVREVVRISGADINSWTEPAGTHRGRRPARIFVIKGDAGSVAQAIYIITAAVDRYKELCEGRYTGQSVPRNQNVLGVTFSYQPPPKSIVPCAASLKELYAPPASIANTAKYANSPPGIFGQAHRRAAAAAAFPAPAVPRGGVNPYDPSTWGAVMQAAAQMGVSPLAALAAATGTPIPGAAFAPYAAFNAFTPSAMNFMGGVGFAQNPGAGFGGQNPVSGGFNMPGISLNPVAGFAMNPALGAAGFMGGGAGDMIGTAGGLFDAGPAGAVGAVDSPHDQAGFGPWGPASSTNMFDPSDMSQLMVGAGLYGAGFGAPAAATFDPAAGGLDHSMMAAMAAAAGIDPSMLAPAPPAAADDQGVHAAGGYGALLNAAPIQSAAPSHAAASTVPRQEQLSRASSTGSKAGRDDNAAAAAAAADIAAVAAMAATAATRTGSGNKDVAAVAPATAVDDAHARQGTAADPSGDSASSKGRRSGGRSSAGRPPAGAWAPAIPFAAAPAAMAAPYPYPHAPVLPPLMIPTAEPAAGTAAVAPGSPPPPAVMSPARMPYPPASPGGPMLGPFGPLFHPSPGGPYMHAYGPPVAMSPYGPVPASPFRVMRDKSGAAVPYVEMGGAVYFAPPSPMPPRAAAPVQGGEHVRSSNSAAAEGEGQGDATLYDAADVDSSNNRARVDSAGRQRVTSAGRSSRPQSGGTPLRMAGAALKLLEDNPYLVQDTIGSGHQQRSPTERPQQPPLQRSNSGGYGPARQYYNSNRGNNAVMRSPGKRGGYGGASPRQLQQWQAKPPASSMDSDALASNAEEASRGSAAAAAAATAAPGMHRKVGGGSSAAALAGTAVGDSSSTDPPKFNADAITAALKLPGRGSSGSSVKQDFGKAGSPDTGSREDQTDGGSNSNSTMCTKSPSMTLLSAIPEDTSAANSPAAAAGHIVDSSSHVRANMPQLNAQDPIVSPGRITLASKVKAARLYSSGFAKPTAPGSGSPPGATE